MGVLGDISAAVAREADLERLMIESTMARAHQHASRVRMPKAPGRARGGLSTIRVASDAPHLPVRIIGTPHKRNDIALAHDWIDGSEADAVIADKGNDADDLDETNVQSEADVVVSPKRNSKVRCSCDEHPHQDRNAVEQHFCVIEHLRRVATDMTTSSKSSRAS